MRKQIEKILCSLFSHDFVTLEDPYVNVCRFCCRKQSYILVDEQGKEERIDDNLYYDL